MSFDPFLRDIVPDLTHQLRDFIEHETALFYAREAAKAFENLCSIGDDEAEQMADWWSEKIVQVIAIIGYRN